MASKDHKSSPIGHFFSKISRRMRSKSPVPLDISHTERFKDCDDKENGFMRLTAPESLPNTPHRFGTFLDRLSRKKTKKIGKEGRDKSVDCGSECEDNSHKIHFSSPRPAISENDLRHVTLKRGTEITTTPLAGATFFMSEDNLASSDCGVSPYRTPSYVRISCALNGYMKSPLHMDGTPVKAVGKSLVERRLWQFQIHSPESQKSTPRSGVPVDNNSSLYQMGNSFSTPSPVKALIGQFDKLALCSVNKDEDDKLAREDIKPHNIVIEQPINYSLTSNKDEAVNWLKGTTNMPNDTIAFTKVGERVEEDFFEPSNSTRNEIGKLVVETEAENLVDMNPRSGDGFAKLLEYTRNSLKANIERALKDLETVESLPETAADCIRMAAGKAQLLVGKKLTKFDELVKKNMKPVMDDPQPATIDDLEGYWALVEIELTDIKTCFEKVELWRSNDWNLDEELVNQTSSKIVGLNNNAATKSIKNVAPSRKPYSEKQKAAAELRRKHLAEAKAKIRANQSEATKLRPEGLMVL